MIYIKLFFIFFRIGLFSFGGGYAMIPLIQDELEIQGWMDTTEFHSLIAISEITPGSISVNSATLVGYHVGGIPGAAIATAGIVLPSLLLALLISKFMQRHERSELMQEAFLGMRPVICGLIVAAALFVAETSILKQPITLGLPKGFAQLPELINIKALVILGLTLLGVRRLKAHPILVLTCSALAGIILTYWP